MGDGCPDDGCPDNGVIALEAGSDSASHLNNGCVTRCLDPVFFAMGHGFSPEIGLASTLA